MVGARQVGLGFRSELAADLLGSPRSVDFVEVVAESCFVQPALRREAQALTELWPVIPHGVKLSLGSAEGIERDRARSLGALAKELRAPLVSEHVAFVRSRDREIGHLTAPPRTRAALDVVVENVDRARRHLPDVPFFLENVAWSFEWPESSLSEGEFHGEIAERTGCPLLLDVGNLYANATNAGLDPVAELEKFPLDRIGMLHMAGGVFEDGFYFDDHAHAIPDPVFALLEVALDRTGSVPILIERDAAFPAFAELSAELERCRRAQAGLPGAELALARSASGSGPDSAARAELAQRQWEATAALTDVAEPSEATRTRHGERALMRARAILKRKRVDEALPILSCLSRRKPELLPLAESVIAQTERVPRMCAISDAWHIAERALLVPALEADARRDCFALRSRFVRGREGDIAQRRAPFVGQLALGGGRTLWAVKGPGTRSRVRFIERTTT